MEKIMVSLDDMATMGGSETESKISALLEKVGPWGKHAMFDGEYIVDKGFDDLKCQFDRHTEGTAEELSTEQKEQRVVRLLNDMIGRLRDRGYEVVFEDSSDLNN